MYLPEEIIVVREVLGEPVTRLILKRCAGVPVQMVETNKSRKIAEASQILRSVSGLPERIAAGKKVLALISTADVIHLFDMPDGRMGCPHFLKLVLATNGCPYECAWCYLRLTYRGNWPFMAVRVRYDRILKKILRYVKKNSSVVTLFNMGELQDGLALESLIGTAQVLIPFFAELPNCYLFILTKSDDVGPILRLRHNGHTILAWSLNAPEVSRDFEIGAPPFERRLRAAQLAEKAGYPIRFRLDPIVPVSGWETMYAEAIEEIFEQIAPERITLGTLRFEEEYINNRRSIVGEGKCEARLLAEMEKMVPMLPPKQIFLRERGKKVSMKTKVSVGKYSYPSELRVELFRFAIGEIRKYFGGPIALCKEVKEVWNTVGLDHRHCRCVCQYDEAELFCNQ